jgi:DNA-binding NtrC family response regulator
MKPVDLPGQLERIERIFILRALEHTAGDKRKAAALLGMARRRFYRRLERLKIGDQVIKRRARG